MICIAITRDMLIHDLHVSPKWKRVKIQSPQRRQMSIWLSTDTNFDETQALNPIMCVNHTIFFFEYHKKLKFNETIIT